MTVPNLRPMTIGDLLDAAFRLYRSHFVTFVGIVALLQVPMAIVQIVVQFFTTGRALTDIVNFSNNPPPVLPGQNPLEILPIASYITFFGIAFVLGLVQYLVVYSLITGALSRAISKSYFHQPVSILDSYAIGWRQFLSLVVAALIPYFASFIVVIPIFGLVVGGIAFVIAQSGGGDVGIVVLLVLALGLVSLAVFIGALILYVRFLLFTQTIVLEHAGPFRALGRSWSLTKGAFWRSLALIIMMSILVSIVSSIPASGLSFALQLSTQTIDDMLRASVISSIVSQIGLIIALPLQFIVYTLLYYDLRIRREGYDLELQVQQAATA